MAERAAVKNFKPLNPMKTKVLYALRQSEPARAGTTAWHAWYLVAEELAKAGVISRKDLRTLAGS
jgi:hypothetical protein